MSSEEHDVTFEPEPDLIVDEGPPEESIEDDGEGNDEELEEPLTLVPKRCRNAVSVREDDTDNWGNEDLDDKEAYVLQLRDPAVRSELIERLATFRRNRELTDCVLFVKEREIFAHKVVLAALSPAMLDMFTSQINEESAAVTRSQTSSPPLVNGSGPNGNGGASGDLEGGAEEKKKGPGSEKSDEGRPLRVAALKRNAATPTFFEFEHTDYECMEALVTFAYTASLEISSKKVAELYKCAHSLKMMSVVKACANYLAANLAISNCIGVRKHAVFSQDYALVEKVDRFIVENVEEIMNDSAEFTQLPCIKTRVIVGTTTDEDGTILAQRAVQYFAEQAWVKCGAKSDHPLESLLVKTHLLYVEDDKKLADCAEMDERSSVGSCDIIVDYKKSKETASSNKLPDAVGAPAVQHRVTGAMQMKMNNGLASSKNHKYSSTESLDSVSSSEDVEDTPLDFNVLAVHKTGNRFWIALVILFRRVVTISLQLTDEDDLAKSKGNGSSSSSLASSKEEEKQKAALLARLVQCTGAQRRQLAQMNEPRCSTGAVFFAGKIIVCGGYDRGECLKSVEEYDVSKGTWSALPAMINGRGRFDATVLDGKVYAIAGSNGITEMKSCEVFDRKEMKWTKVKSLAVPRSQNGCTSLGGYVYTVGGTSENLPLKTVERYSPATESWEEVAGLEVPRYQVAVTVWRGLIIAAGGSDRWACTGVVEAYDPKTGVWKQLAKLRTPRRGCGCAVYRDQLWVVGGNDGQQSLSSVEILDSPTSEWRAGPSMVCTRANTKAIVTAGNVIYVIGGFNGKAFLNTIECLESEATGWRNWQQSATEDIPEEEEEGDEDTETLKESEA